MGPTRGVAQEAWGRREDGTDPPIRRLSSLIKAWPGVPMAPNMLIGMIMSRMRSGKGPYSVSRLRFATAMCAARRVRSVWLVVMWVGPAGSKVLMSMRVKELQCQL
jgi:hypothetical protein